MNTEPNIEKRTYEVRWMLANGETGRQSIDVEIDTDRPADSVWRSRGYAKGRGFMWATTAYVVAMRLACDILRYAPVTSFIVARLDAEVQFPPMAPSLGSIGGPVAYEVWWIMHDGVPRRSIVEVKRDELFLPRAYVATVGHRTFECASPYVAAYTAAAELLYRLPVETFTVTPA